VEAERDEVELGRGSPGTGLNSQRRGTILVTLIVLIVGTVAVAALLLERRVYHLESAMVKRCAAGTTYAVQRSNGQVDAMYDYVRSSMESIKNRSIRDGLHGMVAKAASDASADLNQARADCADIDILAVHGKLRERHASCLRTLALQARYLDAVAIDGLTARPRARAC